MVRIPRFFAALCILLSMMALASNARSATGDTTVTTFVNHPVDIDHRHAIGRFELPHDLSHYKKIFLIYTLSCPEMGCDPWDRVSELNILQKDRNDIDTAIEIGRVITPYGRGFTWALDVTDYRPLLHDSITLENHIHCYVRDGAGWLVTIRFQFIAGEPDVEAYAVRNLYFGSPTYGDPANPIEKYLPPLKIKADNQFDFAKVISRVTGHGQGNTDEAAEFARKLHSLEVNGTTFSHYLWRDDCGQNPCQPQYGSWQESRAGFCPGEPAVSWDNDITSYIKRNTNYTLQYKVEPYINHCRPGAQPCDCPDCNFNYYGHTEPFYHIVVQLVYYRSVKHTSPLDNVLTISDETPHGLITINTHDKSGDVDAFVEDVTGRIVYHQELNAQPNHAYTLDLSNNPGVYIVRLKMDDSELSKRITVHS